MLSVKFLMSLFMVTSMILLGHAVQSGSSPQRQRASAAAKATTDNPTNNFAVSSTNGNPGTVKKTTKDGVTTIESGSNFVSPDGKSRSSSWSSSSTSSSAPPPNLNNKNRRSSTKQATTKDRNGSPARRTTNTDSSGGPTTDSKLTSAKAQAAATGTTNGQNFVSTTANDNPGTIKRTVTKEGETIESMVEHISPDGRSRSFSKTVSSTKSRP